MKLLLVAILSAWAASTITSLALRLDPNVVSTNVVDCRDVFSDPTYDAAWLRHVLIRDAQH